MNVYLVILAKSPSSDNYTIRILPNLHQSRRLT